MRFKTLLQYLMVLVCCGVLVSCDTSMQDMQAIRVEKSQADLALYKALSNGNFQNLTLDDTVSLALSRNLNIWLANQEKAIRKELQTGSLLKLLPEFGGNVSWDGTDALSASESLGLFSNTDAQLSQYSYSQEKEHTFGGWGMVWNIMDFGVSFFRYQQNIKQTAIAAHDLRRTRQKIALDVTSSYYRCIAMHRVCDHAEVFRHQLQQQLDNIQQGLQKKQISESEAIGKRYPLQKQMKKIAMYRQAYESEKLRLAQLIGIPAGRDFSLVDQMQPHPGEFMFDIEDLRKKAILQRPEMFQEDLQEAITYDEARLTLLQMLPSPSMMLRNELDDNKFLYYNSWTHWSMDVSWNLFAIPQKLMEYKSHKMRAEFIKKRRLAMAVAILTQLQLAVIEHQFALEQFQLSARISADSDKMVENIQNAVKAGKADQTKVIEQQARQLDELAEYMKDYAQVMTARARIYNSIGTDPMANGRVSMPDMCGKCLEAPDGTPLGVIEDEQLSTEVPGEVYFYIIDENGNRIKKEANGFYLIEQATPQPAAPETALVHNTPIAEAGSEK